LFPPMKLCAGCCTWRCVILPSGGRGRCVTGDGHYRCLGSSLATGSRCRIHDP
jgi:hypothetical protein